MFFNPAKTMKIIKKYDFFSLEVEVCNSHPNFKNRLLIFLFQQL